MARAKVEWNGKKFNAALAVATQAGLKRGTIFLHGKLKQEVATPATKVRKRRKRDTTAGKKGSQYTHYEGSKPGEPPQRRTGTGQKNIVHEHGGTKKDPRSRVGVAEPGIHLLYLELGTHTTEPRPWFLSTMKRYWRTIANLFMSTANRKIPKT